MGDNSAQVDILIKAIADTAGLKLTAADAEKVKTALKQAGVAGQEAGDEIKDGADKAANSVDELKGGLHDLGGGLKSAKILSAGLALAMQGDVTNGLKLASFAVKGFNAALKDSPLGILGLIAGLGLALPKLIAHFQGTAGAAKEHGAAVQGAGEKSQEAAGKVDGLSEAVKHAQAVFEGAGHVADSFAKDLEAANAKSEALSKALQAVAEARGKLALVDIDRQEIDKEITPEQAEIRRKQVSGDVSAGNAEAQRKQAQSAYFEAQEARKQLGRGIDEQEGKATDNEERLTALQQMRDATTQLVEDFKKLDSQRGLDSADNPVVKHGTEDLVTLREEIAKLEQTIADSRSAAEAMKGKVPASDEALRLAGLKMQGADLGAQAAQGQAANDLKRSQQAAAEAQTKRQAEERAKGDQAALADLERANKEHQAKLQQAKENQSKVEEIQSQITGNDAELKMARDHEHKSIRNFAEHKQAKQEVEKLEQNRAQLEQEMAEHQGTAKPDYHAATEAAEGLLQGKLRVYGNEAAKPENQSDAAKAGLEEKRKTAMGERDESVQRIKQQQQDEADKAAQRDRQNRLREGKSPVSRRIEGHATESPADRAEDERRSTPFQDQFRLHMPSTAAPAGGGGGQLDNAAQQTHTSATNLDAAASKLAQAGSKFDSAASKIESLASMIDNFGARIDQIESRQTGTA